MIQHCEFQGFTYRLPGTVLERQIWWKKLWEWQNKEKVIYV